MNNLAIGVFDSGVGGLTAVKAIRKIMPNEDIIYFGDTLRMPYGNKDKLTIINYANQNIKFLESCGVKVVLAACGTVSSYLSKVSSKVKIFGVIKPACEAAIKSTSSGRIGVLGTYTAINSNSYGTCLSRLSSEIKYWQNACPLLASLIEAGHISPQSSVLRTILDFYVSPLLHKNVDTIILGCTHYPLVNPVIREIFGKEFTLINSGLESARALKALLKAQRLKSNDSKNGKATFYCSGNEKNFLANIKLFLEKDLEYEVKKIDIEKF